VNRPSAPAPSILRARYLTADVFTDRAFGGNQLAVFPDASSIPEALLQSIAREFNYSETTFVFPPTDGRHTRRLRIFTPATEMPFAGHPTLGAAHVLAATGELALTGEETRFVFEEQAGLISVVIRALPGAALFQQLSAPRLPEIGPPPPPRDRVAEALSLEADALRDGAWAPQAVSCGFPFLFVPLRDRAAVARARVRLDVWDTVLKDQWASALFVFSQDPELPGSHIHARMFAPGQGVAEDPATGGACVALAGYLGARDTRSDGTLRWRVEQGFEMGRPSLLDIEADKRHGAIVDVRVGGQAVIVCEGSLIWTRKGP
jgi:trans-2,3-dihydro-3-hydroxyanthranilate isomerase